ncbi:MAG: SsrA-binding protein [Candidatus Anoxychlamydiales bacterium]|nr:SsrA-binding protein [Candidatus Anoxychlamydiales bacterium]
MSKDLVSNKKAFYDYEILDTFEAGIVLVGSEIKSLKDHTGSLQDSYVIIKKNELFVENLYIAPYKFSKAFPHEERRQRKLLMHRHEIDKIAKKTKEKGFSIIPLSIYLKKGKAKIKIAIAKGKKAFDKRAKMKEKEDKASLRKIF